MENRTEQNTQKKNDFLMEIAYLSEQMANKHISLSEGYEKLLDLLKKEALH